MDALRLRPVHPGPGSGVWPAFPSGSNVRFLPLVAWLFSSRFLVTKPTPHKLKLRKESGPLHPLPHRNRSAPEPRVGLSFHICKNGARPCVSPQGWGDVRESGCSKTVHSLPLSPPSCSRFWTDPVSPSSWPPHHLTPSQPQGSASNSPEPTTPPPEEPPAPSRAPGPISNLDVNLEQLRKPHLLREACLDGSFPTRIK